MKFSEIVETPAPRSGPHHDLSPTVGLEELCAALGAANSVKINRLEYRLYAVLETACAKIVRQFNARLLRLKAVDDRAKLGSYHRVSVFLAFKSVPLVLLALKTQNLCLHRQLLLLQPQKSIQQIRDELLHLTGSDIGLADQALDALREVYSALRQSNRLGGDAKNGR